MKNPVKHTCLNSAGPKGLSALAVEEEKLASTGEENYINVRIVATKPLLPPELSFIRPASLLKSGSGWSFFSPVTSRESPWKEFKDSFQ